MFEKGGIVRDSIDFESRLKPLTQATLVDRTVLGRRMAAKEKEFEPPSNELRSIRLP